MSVWMNMFVVVIDEEMKEIKNQRHSCISHQMKVVNVDLQPNKLRQVERMIVDILIGCLVEFLLQLSHDIILLDL